MPSLRRRALAVAGAVTVALTPLASAVPAQAAPSRAASTITYNEREQAWLFDRVSTLLVATPGPGGPTGPGDQPDVTLYAVGPQDPDHPQGLGGTFPLPPEAGGGTITIPQRDIVLPYPVVQPSDCFGAYVVPGPRATARTVLTRVDPNGSGIPLAYAVDLGFGPIPLTASWKIQAGIALGLLRADPSLGYGGTCATDLTRAPRR